MNFKSNDVRIADIFTIDNIKSYNVPIYQRNYAWTVDNIEALITDIDNEPAGYYLGNIIAYHFGKDKRINAFLAK